MMECNVKAIIQLTQENMILKQGLVDLALLYTITIVVFGKIIKKKIIIKEVKKKSEEK